MRPLPPRTRREFLKLVGAVGSGVLLPPWMAACGDRGDATGPTLRPLDASPVRAPVEGYTDRSSYLPGNAVRFHLSNNWSSPSIRVDVVRAGGADTPMVGSWSGQVEKQPVPANASQAGCDWPVAFELPIPSDWRSGVYLARCWVGPVTNPMWATTLPFIVKAPHRTSPILYQVPVATYQAYNSWGGTSLYTKNGQGLTAPLVSFDRPYAHLRPLGQWDLPFIQWMERAGIAADYCTSLDLHDAALDLRAVGYQLLLSVGHDEYWTWEMRDHVEAFIANGGNVAFFGGNTCWWQARIEADGRRMVCYKETPQRPQRDPAWGSGPEGQRRVTGNWFASPVNRPEERMTGLSFRYGAGYFNVAHVAADVPFQAGPCDHWAFAGASVGSGAFGRGAIGFETDGACLRLGPDGAAQIDDHNIVEICEDAGEGQYSPPDSIMLLATTARLAWPGKVGRAVVAAYRNNGVVFNVGSSAWPAALAASNQVRAITHNVLRRLTGALPPSPALLNLGFASWSAPGAPDGWDTGSAASPVQQLFEETRPECVHTGACLRANAAAGPVRLTQSVNVLAGEYYVVSGWIRSSAPIVANDGQSLTIRLEDTTTGQQLLTARYRVRDGGWEHVRGYGRVAGTGSVAARLVVESLFPGDAWFAGLKVDVL